MRKKKARPIIDTYGVFRACQRVAQTDGLQLKMDDKCKVPWTDMKTGLVTVPTLSAYSTPDQVTIWRGSVYHECGHHSPEVKDIGDLIESKEIGMDSYFGKVINIIEDIRNEKNNLGVYPGRDSALSEANELIITEACDNMEKNGVPEQLQDLLDVQALALLERADWQPHLAVGAPRFAKLASPNLEKLKTLIPDIKSMVTAQDVYEIARKICEHTDKDPDEEEKKAKEVYCKSKPKAGKSKEGEGESTDVSYKDILLHPHSDKTEAAGKGGTIRYDHDWGSYEFKPWDKRVEIVQEAAPSIRARISKAYSHGTKLSHRVKRLFQSQSQERRAYYKKSGRLSAKDLYRVPAGDTDVFWQTSTRLSAKGTAIFLLTDASGSMSGTKFDTTAAAVALMNDALSPLKPALKIATFTEGTEIKGVEHHRMKDWRETVTADTIMKRYSNYTSHCIQNSDGESILWAGHELAARPEKRKILIVLSDGLPETDAPGDAAQFTLDAVNHISKYVECYGLGIEDESVKHFYPTWAVVHNVRELEDKLLGLIKDIMGGSRG